MDSSYAGSRYDYSTVSNVLGLSTQNGDQNVTDTNQAWQQSISGLQHIVFGVQVLGFSHHRAYAVESISCSSDGKHRLRFSIISVSGDHPQAVAVLEVNYWLGTGLWCSPRIREGGCFLFEASLIQSFRTHFQALDGVHG